MTVKIGPEWLIYVVPKKVESTVKNRTNNEKNFRDFIKNEIYLMDFSDLGRCIYSYSSGGIKTIEDLVNKILNMEKTHEAVSELQEQVKSNQEKFFEDSFKNKNFQSQWEELTNIRNKVAHNNLFIIDDGERGKNLAENLLSTIEEANKNILNKPFSDEEREIMIENLASPAKEVATEETAKIVTEEEFIEKLQKQEEYMKNAREDGFVGIGHFINRSFPEREG